MPSNSLTAKETINKYQLRRSLRDKIDGTGGTSSNLITSLLPEEYEKYIITVTAKSDSNILLDGTVTEVDGVTLVDDDIVLVTGQTIILEDGIYYVNSSGWVRYTDLYPSMIISVESGTVNDNTIWLLSNDTIDIGTDQLIFIPIASSDELVKVGTGGTADYLDEAWFANDGADGITPIKAATASNSQYFGLDVSGNKGFYDLPTADSIADGLVTGNTLRWDGSDWVETDTLQIPDDTTATKINIDDNQTGLYLLKYDNATNDIIKAERTTTYDELFSVDNDGVIFSKSLEGTGTRNIATNADGEIIVDDAGLSGGLEYWTENRNTSAPNATIPAHQFIATGAETNIDAVISPKGTGALLGNLPDGLASGGDKRGTNAVDLQLIRNNADDVASGAYSSITGGRYNAASGTHSVVGGGYDNNARGAYSAVLGGQSCTITVNGYSAVIVGGQVNEIDSANSFIGGGYYNEIDTNVSNRSAIVSGSNNFISSWCGGILAGYYGKVINYGQYAHASGRFAATGDAQTSELIWRKSVNSTGSPDESEAFLDGSSTRFVLPNYSTVQFMFNYAVRRIGSTTMEAGGLFAVTVSRDNGLATTAIVGTNTQLHFADNSSSYSPPVFQVDGSGNFQVLVYTPNGYNCQHIIRGVTAETFASS